MYLSNNIIYIKKLTMRFSKEFTRLFNDPHITRYMSIPYPLTNKWVKEYIIDSMEKYKSNNKLTWGIFRADLDKFVGVGVLKDIDEKNRVARLGYSIGKQYWNRGYTLMTVRLILKYAYETMDLNRVEVRIEMDDERSLKLMESLGGEREGIMRQALYYNENHKDVYLYSILKDDYYRVLQEKIESRKQLINATE